MKKGLIFVVYVSSVFLLGGFAQAQNETVLEFPLNAGQEQDPASTSTATGCGTATLSADQTTLTLEVKHNVVRATAAHIHMAAAGVNGDIIITLDHTVKPISETLTLDAGQVTELLAGGLYVNIHTEDNPAGEIRGQIIDSMCPDPEGNPMNGCVADPSQGAGNHGLVEGSLGDLLLLIIVATVLLLSPIRRAMRAS